ncbi:MAG: amino acid adenylation domain-containing protein [Proteobacteria bacterium]|nr:amino acid adenylation domain-containing protein [Pseudomonadota bacterium]
MMPTQQPRPSESRLGSLQGAIIEILEQLSGSSDIDPDASFIALGFDSLLLGQVARAVEKKFRTRVTFRQLLNDLSSVARLASHLDATLPPDAVAPATTSATPAQTPAPAATVAMPVTMPNTAPDAIAAVMQAQMQTMQALFAEQLRTLQGQPAGAAAPVPMAAPAPATSPAPAPIAPAPAPQATGEGRIRLYQPSAARSPDTLTNSQRAYVESLVRRVNERTPLTKARTQADRGVLADPRTAAGFRSEWKELVYPIVAARAQGSKIWDIDGNAYIDLVNGYGQTMFGHSPDFVTEAIMAQLQEGFPIGPQTPLAGEVAALVSELTGNERVTFCNTGSEAVMAAMRVARAVTGRERVVVFANDYHGQFDEVLVKAGNDELRRGRPVAPGIPDASVANITVLPYGEAQSLEWIERHCEDLAAVLVEPVQSRHPALRPQAFVQALRSITAAKGTALVFDEIVTGFRVHPGGMQALFGIRADMATYGKVAGGGMPIGILAGSAQFMDALDGGFWRYGDDSVPETAPTFFAGTFVRHPLVLAAARAVLKHIKAEGPALQEGVATRMGGLVDTINRDLERRGLTARAEGYSSWFYLSLAGEGPLASLFWPQARLQGIHVQEAYPCFLTTAHSDADIASIAEAFSASLDALESAGILGGTRERAASPPRAADEEISAPLTEPQLEILAAAQLGDEASCAFNESVSLTLDGDLDTDALAAAVSATIDRHEALRGRLGRSDERMHFAPKLGLVPALKDLSQASAPEAALAALVAEDACTPFDLWAGPLVRAVLVRLARDRHVLLFTAHHIVCDGWSMNVILNEVADHYRAGRSGGAASTSLATSFAQYANEHAQPDRTRAEDLLYWKELYRDLPAPPDLPTDRPRPPLRAYAGATWSTHFDAALLAALKKAGAANGATLFAVLFTALQTVMGRLTGHDDIPIGVPMAGQSLEDRPDLVGHCVHMLPFRVPLDWNAPFGRHVAMVAQRVLEGIEHGNCTYGTVVRALPLPRAANRLPLTEIQFNLERLGDSLDFGGVAARVVPNAKAAVNFDLFVNIIESNAGLRIDCDYSTTLFDEATIARWMAHYQRLLEALAAAPETLLSALPVLTDAQERSLLDTFNATAMSYPQDSCIHDLVAAQAKKTPQAVAYTDAGGDLTYADLDRQSSRLAAALLEASPVRHGRFAVATDRSRALPVALLGVMKAGHAYVPLDPQQPEDRLRQIAAAARIDGVVCQDARLAAIAPGAAVIRLDELDLASPGDTPELPPVTSDASAYILFTSGSTGAPKGVEIRHRGLTNIMCDVVRRCGITATDCAVASSAVTFDVAATELYAPLIVGGRVVLATMEEVKSGFDLVARAQAVKATVMQATPTLWRMLLEAGFKSHPGLRMIAAGEPLTRDLADQLLAGGGRLWNLYGPTETTIYSAGREILADGTPVTIGGPLANTQLYVLDSRDAVVPPGAVGTLFIGGHGLAKGYFDRPDLTEAAFRMISLADRPPCRLYATGDLARLSSTGEIELLGRADRQVKLRGFRIELEEIEHVLRQAPGVRDCAVLLRNDTGPDPALVAYVVGLDEGSVASLSSHLAGHLPDYMVPMRWVSLAALPLTSSGKLDRKALPPPVRTPANVDVPPVQRQQSPLESRIAAVWADVLGLDSVPIDCPLFTLGADSLQVFRIAARLVQDGISVEARDLMRNPSIAVLAQRFEQSSGQPEAAPARKGPSLAEFRHGARRRAGAS